ncbi:MAG: ribosome-associated translation inhibitor RaiA [Thermoleophilia bacterium]
MKLIVKGRNMELTDALVQHAEEKIGRFGKYLFEGAQCDIELMQERNPAIPDNQVAEVTIFTKGPVIRAREATGDMYASIDLVADKLERQVKKYRGRVAQRHALGHREAAMNFGIKPPEEPGAGELESDLEEEGSPQIVKIKQFQVKPMTPEEAALQMELIGHDFFVFTNVESQDTAVVYRRRDGDYGLIEPQR